MRKFALVGASVFLCVAASAAEIRSDFISYEKYGNLTGVGTEDYSFEVADPAALAEASGEGIYPNRSHEKNAAYLRFVEKASKPVKPWDYSAKGGREEVFAWLASEEPDGVKLYFIAEAHRKAGKLQQALKAYHALVVHFPRTVIWSADRAFYWYAAPEAIARIRKICAEHPELELELLDTLVEVERSSAKDPEKDRVVTWPGRFEPRAPKKADRSEFRVTAERGKGRVRLVQYDGRRWELLVDGKPFFVKGVTYTSTTVGESAHAINLRPWMTLDDDKNGKNDPMFDSWIDADRNGERGENEKAVGDARLLKEMGANAIRAYHGVDHLGDYDPKGYDKELMRELNRDYGIYFVMGDFFGAYTLGSKANWEAGTDYTDEEQKKNMLASLRAMVEDHKGEPYVLFWLLGNENQHPHTRTNADREPEAYGRFLNEAAQMIHELDPDHPVAVGNLTTEGLAEIARHAPEIDIYGANVYSGAYSMGSVWHKTRRLFDRPVVVTEMGCDAYADGQGPDEKGQAEYFRGNWRDVALNSADGRGEGNAIGGIVFEWMDEWWKSSKGNTWGDPEKHNVEGDFPGPFPDGWMHEEWLGVFGQGDGRHSHFLREKRALYDEIREAWTA